MNAAFLTPTNVRCGVFFPPLIPNLTSASRFHHHPTAYPNHRKRPKLHVSRHSHPPVITTATATGTSWVAPESSALNYDNKSSNFVTRYIDLRTMEVILPDDAHLDPTPTPNSAFSPIPPLPQLSKPPTSTASLSSSPTSGNYSYTQKLSKFFFTADTVPLSDSQKEAVQALLSHRSVIYACSSPDDKFLLFLDIVLRARVWRKVVVYCASSRRVAEVMYTTICTQLGSERRHEVLLDLDDGNDFESNNDSYAKSSFRVIITCPTILKNEITNLDSQSSSSWVRSACILFIDNVSDSLLPVWEEIFLSIPASIQLCLLSTYLTRPHLELLPVWMETIQNSTSIITSSISSSSTSPSSSTSSSSSASSSSLKSSSSKSNSPSYPSAILNRIERPKGMPLLRTFAYNAATHSAPVQVSLAILKELLLKEIDEPVIDFIPEYSKALLSGITVIPAENPKNLLFRNVKEAAFADVASLIVPDAKKVEEVMKSKSKRRTSNNNNKSKNSKNSQEKKKERTASSRAAARRRRENAYSQSMVLPAIILVKGHEQAIHCGDAIESALYETENVDKNDNMIKTKVDLLWDEDMKNHVKSIVRDLTDCKISKNGEDNNNIIDDELSDLDSSILGLLCNGIGVINSMMTSSLRIIIEELFRSSLIPLIIFDTHLGSDELLSLPCAKSVIVESDCIASCDDKTKGILSASTVVSLTGRKSNDDVGNLIFTWYDELIDDETSGYEIANNLLSNELLSTMMISSSSTSSLNNFEDNISENDFFNTGLVSDYNNELNRQNPATFAHNQFDVRKGIQTKISSTYDSILRSLQRFGVDGTDILHEYTLSSFKGWLKRASVQATLEKLSIEKTAIDERIQKEDWKAISDYERKTAKFHEAQRLLNAMKSKVEKALERKLLLELKKIRPGRILGIRLKSNSSTKKISAQRTESDEINSKVTTNELDKQDQQDVIDNKDDPYKTGKLTYAAFVTLFDQESKGKKLPELNHRYVVICIMTDGLWTMVPLRDIESISEDNEFNDDNDENEDARVNNILPNIDLLELPHPATFDVEPGYEIAKSSPVDESEQKSLNRISDELINRITSESPVNLLNIKIAEVEEQQQKADLCEEIQKESGWYGREDEIKELRKLRRRSAELGDKMEVLQKRKIVFETEISETNDDYKSIQTCLMAVLEDCHALLFKGRGQEEAKGTLSNSNHMGMNIEMTPIGSLTCKLPCQYSLFASACLCLIDELGELSVGEITALVAIVIGDSRYWNPKKISHHGITFEDDNEMVENELGENDEYYDENSKLKLANKNESDIDYNNEDELLENLNSESKRFDNYNEDIVMNKILGENRKEANIELKKLNAILPLNVCELLVEIQQALRQLHRRHLYDCQAVQRIWMDDIVPRTMNDRLAKAAMLFVEGTSWKEVVDLLQNEGSYAVSEFKKIRYVLGLMWKSNGENGEFDEKTVDKAFKAWQLMDRWPIAQNDSVDLVLDGGIIEKQWNGNTYDKWWRSVKDDVKQMKSQFKSTDLDAPSSKTPRRKQY